jgi:hypothetical protein
VVAAAIWSGHPLSLLPRPRYRAALAFEKGNGKAAAVQGRAIGSGQVKADRLKGC